MRIGGFNRFSLIDYPGQTSAVVFTQGCNFRCPYCHNPELVDPDEYGSSVPETEVLSFLEHRKGKLDAVVITGGEPTIQPDLADFIKKVRSMGFRIKLDTNGSNPDIIEDLLDEELVDYVAMDAKGPLERYNEIVNADIDLNRIKRSMELIKASEGLHEFRTTMVNSLLTERDMLAIGKWLRGAKLYVLQEFVASKALNPGFLDEKTYPREKLDSLKKILEGFVGNCKVR